MKRIVALTLALVMIVALFAGCNASKAPETTAAPELTDQEKLVGTWKGEMDLTEAMKEEVGDDLEGFEMGEFKVTVIFKFTQEGTYTMELEEESVEQAMENMITGMEGYLKAMMEAQAQELGMSLEDLLAASGMTMDDMMTLITAAMEEQDLVGELVKEAKTEGKYQAKDGKLFNTQSLDEEIDENVYDTYTLEGDVLTLTESFGMDDEDADMMTLVYPIILKKAA